MFLSLSKSCMQMECKQSEPYGATSNLDESACPSDTEHTSKNEKLSPYSPKSHETDRRRSKSLPVYQSSTLKEFKERGKRVQFADTMGLNLASVRHFDIPDDPNETCNVLSGLQSSPSQELQHGSDNMSALNFTRLVPAFSIGSDKCDFKSRSLGVALESVTSGSEVQGLIRVMVNSARKDVGIRYTVNDWLTFSDVEATPTLNEEHVLQWEQFRFTLPAPAHFGKYSSLHFAVYCRTDHEEYWDNNDGQNYTLNIQTN